MKKSLERFYPYIIFLFAIVLYANTISNGYNLDDELVTINHRTTSKGFDGIKEIFNGFYYEDDMGYKYEYRPITHLTFAIEHQFLGESPQISHAINVILYGLLGVLIFLLVNKMAPDRGPSLALIVSLLFLIHPLHTEVVASIKNRDEILSLLFSVLAMLSIFKLGANRKLLQQVVYWLGALMLFSLSLLSKPSGAMLVFLIPVLHYLFNDKRFNLFTVLFGVLAALMFTLFRLNNLLNIVLIPTLTAALICLMYLFEASNQEYVRLKVKQATQQECFSIFLLILSLTFLVFSFLYPSPHLLFVFYLLAGLSLWFGLLKKYGYLIMLIHFVSYTVASYLSMNFEFLWAYWIVFLFLFVKEAKNKIPVVIFMLAISFGMSWYTKSAYGGVILIAYLIFLTPWKKWLFPLAMLVNIFLHFSIPLIALFYGICMIVMLIYFDWISLNKLTDRFEVGQWKKAILILLTMAIASNGTWFAERGEVQVDIPSSTFVQDQINLINNVGNAFKTQGDTETFNQDYNRPMTFVENPISENWNWNSRIALASNSVMFYTTKMVFPYPLSFYYGFDTRKVQSVFSLDAIVGILLLVFLVLVSWIYRKKSIVLFGSALFFLSLLIYSNFIVPVAGIVAERLAFTASLGFVIILGFGLQELFKIDKLKVPAYVLFIGLIIGASYSVINRNIDWKNKLTLFGNDIKHLEKSAQANAVYAGALMEFGELSNDGIANTETRSIAIAHFKRAIEIYPDFLNWWFDLGRVYFVKKDYLKAKEAFKRASEIDSTYSSTYGYLLDIANMERNAADVIVYSNLFLVNNPNNIDVLLNLSSALYFSEKFEEAILVNDRIIEIDNSIPEAYLNKAYSFIKLGDITIAKSYLAKGKLLSPNHAEVLSLEKLLSGN